MIPARVGVLLVFAALFTIGVSWKYQMDANSALRREIADIHARFELMSEEHARALAAADAALRARDDIYLRMEARSHDLETALRSHPDISGYVLPDSLLRVLKNACAPAARQSAGSDPDTPKDGSADGGRYGAPAPCR